jgi:hypothetical protein
VKDPAQKAGSFALGVRNEPLERSDKTLAQRASCGVG